MGIRTRLLAVFIAVGAVLPVTASAATVPTPTPPTLPVHQIYAGGTVELVNNNNDFFGQVICYANAVPDAVAVAITSCTVDNQSAPARGFSGPIAVTAGSIKGTLAD